MNRIESEIKALEDLMKDQSPIPLTVPMNDLYLIMCSLQFALVDPRLTDHTKEMIAGVGRQLSRYVTLRYPFLRDEIEKGWLLTPPKK